MTPELQSSWPQRRQGGRNETRAVGYPEEACSLTRSTQKDHQTTSASISWAAPSCGALGSWEMESSSCVCIILLNKTENSDRKGEWTSAWHLATSFAAAAAAASDFDCRRYLPPQA